jgi:hypothetical protein
MTVYDLIVNYMTIRFLRTFHGNEKAPSVGMGP